MRGKFILSKRRIELLRAAIQRGGWQGPTYIAACLVYFLMFTLVIPAIVLGTFKHLGWFPKIVGVPLLWITIGVSLIADALAFRRRQSLLDNEFWVKHGEELYQDHRGRRLFEVYKWFFILSAPIVILPLVLKNVTNGRWPDPGSLPLVFDGILNLILVTVTIYIFFVPVPIGAMRKHYPNTTVMIAGSSEFMVARWTRGPLFLVLMIGIFLPLRFSDMLFLSNTKMRIEIKIMFGFVGVALLVLASALPFAYKNYALYKQILKRPKRNLQFSK